RLRAIPFTKEVDAFIKKYDQIFVVEMNRDGQLLQLLYTEYPQHAMKFKSVAYHDGLPAAAKWVREGILAKYEKASSQKPAAIKKAAVKKTVAKAKAAPAKKVAVKKSVSKKPAKSKSAGKAKRK
ncbi:MAG TPA: hypothetical protein PLQ75_07970, partial [Anaerolineales bacterium]|nr:hypothetical protein [Anaerolineales bacterium]